MTEAASFNVGGANLARLRGAIAKLSRCGFHEAGVGERLALPDIVDLRWKALPVYRAERLIRREPLDLAIDLFCLQGVLPADELNRLFDAEEHQALVDAGVLAMNSGGARASIYPVGDTLIFSDHAWPELPHPGCPVVPWDQVMFLGQDSHLLARCTVRRHAGRALDLCTGSGVHALLAASHADQVIGVDLSPRAAACARFNATVMSLGNVTFAVGDLYEPAAGQQFDLITANPPFVPSPLDSLGYRDGGRSGEDVQRRIVAGLPQHLAPGGIAQIVTEIGESDEAPLLDRLRQWLGGAAMDIHVLRFREHSATNYAIGHAKGEEYGEFLESVGEWARNLRDHGHARVISLVATFQWSDPALGTWDRMEESLTPARAAGPEIEASFTAERVTRGEDLATRLYAAVPRRIGPVALLDAQLLGAAGGAEVNAKATLLGQALTIERTLNAAERNMLERIDGRTTVPDLAKSPDDLRSIVSLARMRFISI